MKNKSITSGHRAEVALLFGLQVGKTRFSGQTRLCIYFLMDVGRIVLEKPHYSTMTLPVFYELMCQSFNATVGFKTKLSRVYNPSESVKKSVPKKVFEELLVATTTYSQKLTDRNPSSWADQFVLWNVFFQQGGLVSKEDASLLRNYIACILEALIKNAEERKDTKYQKRKTQAAAMD